MTTLVEAIRRALGEILAAKPEAVLMGQDIGPHGGLFRASAGLHEAFGKARVLDVPPNAPAMLGFARGMKLAGHLPLVEIPPGEPAARAGQALADDVGRWHARSGGAVTGPFVVRVPVGRAGILPPSGTGRPVGAGLAEVDSPEPALIRTTGLTVVCPSRAVDAWAMLHHAVDHERPVVVLEPKSLYRRKGVPLTPDEVPASDVLSDSRIVRHGDDLVFIAWGAGVPAAFEAAERLTAEGYECGVVDVRVLVPLPVAQLAEAIDGTGRAVVVHEGSAAAAGDVVARLTTAAFLALEAPILDVDLVQHVDAPSAMQALLGVARATLDS